MATSWIFPASAYIAVLLHRFYTEDILISAVRLDFIFRTRTRAATGVAQQPEDNGRRVLVTLCHAHTTIYECSFPRGIVSQRMVAVALLVGFVHHIESVVIIQPVHLGVVGVVARADGVQLVALSVTNCFSCFPWASSNEMRREAFFMAFPWFLTMLFTFSSARS